jgi:DNA-binding MarR family transcriptional regulator
MSKLRQEIRQRRPFAGSEEEVFLSLQRTASVLLQALGKELKPHDLTAAQYNLLRILRGAHHAGEGALTCGEIAERLVSPGPDVTRLLDRLEARGLVERLRDAGDRRVVRARITRAGREVLGELDAPVQGALERLLGGLGEARLKSLSRLLEQARAEAGPP